MREIHIVVGVLSIGVNAAAALLGAWLYWRVKTSTWFWRSLRAGQALIVVVAVLGVLAALTGRKPSGLHILYGVLPILVSFLAEQLRAASAEMVLAARGFSEAAEVGRLPRDEQRVVAMTIVQREQGVMALAAIVVVVLLARAAGTGA